MAKIDEKGNWSVKMRCTIIKAVYCRDCTREQAESNPWDFSEDELEIEQEDWEVIKVEPND